ncbi:hypothetical protein EYF80_041487 [Liparis tanakae]|uniref:Uncharacterized protein n=1 Tax=Liparis tanakae TaxID=230148 RepID=A0A4Z2G5I0_9TELE|nr:hypothetical protein EYF80_041487 [Liparis tanakae]
MSVSSARRVELAEVGMLPQILSTLISSSRLLIQPGLFRRISPDEDDLSEVSELVQQLVDERVVEVVVGAGGAERHQDGAVRRPLLGDDLFVDLVPRLRVDLQDVDVDYRHHGVPVLLKFHFLLFQRMRSVQAGVRHFSLVS